MDEMTESELRERLASAELVCALCGTTTDTDDSDRGKATTQAWMDWFDKYGPGPEVDDNLVAELAARRDQIRGVTLRRIRETGR